MTGLAREHLFWKGKPERRASKAINLRTLIPEAIVASTFPLIFFFSLLYYTDVASLCSVLLCYSLGREKKYLASSIVSAFVDLDCVRTRSDSAYDKSHRQALYLCGSGKRTSSGSDSQQSRQPWTYWKSGSDSIVNSLAKCPTSARVSWSGGNPRNADSAQLLNLRFRTIGSNGGLQSTPLTVVVKTYLAAALQEWKVIARVLGTYLPVLLAFVTFVMWNGGIVLGHQEMHVASLHYAQVPYFLAFSTLLGWPILFNEGIWRPLSRAIRLGAGTKT
jgi:alpha-1,2-glucosyltransferase